MARCMMLLRKIKKPKGVTELLVTYGLYDIVMHIEAKSLGQLDKFVANVRQTPEIQQTSTLVGAQ